MRYTIGSALLGLGLLSGVAAAEPRGPYPIHGWNGNEYLFAVDPRGSVTYLTGYRAVGSQWRRVGTTTLQPGQTRADGGFLQRAWFEGRKLGTANIDDLSLNRQRGGGRR